MKKLILLICLLSFSCNEYLATSNDFIRNDRAVYYTVEGIEPSRTGCYYKLKSSYYSDDLIDDLTILRPCDEFIVGDKIKFKPLKYKNHEQKQRTIGQ